MMMKKLSPLRLFFLPAAAALAVSCASVDVQRKVTPPAKAGSAAPQIITVPVDTGPAPPPAVVERPVYIPQESPEPAAKKPALTPDAARAAVAAGTRSPAEYSHAATVYDYDKDWVYEVYCQTLRVTDIQLKNNEAIAEPPFISDSDRWKIGAGVSYENGEAVQHVYVKPDQSGLEASLIINTNERVYHLILRSFQTVHMPLVYWRYPQPAPMPLTFFTRAPESSAAADADASYLADPRFLSFNYRITYQVFNKPRWMPVLAYDDGKKTYIVFPDESLQAELPAVFENRADAVNYRLVRNIVIIDKLIEAVTVKLGSKSVIIRKKKG